jgi:hypothetical protein
MARHVPVHLTGIAALLAVLTTGCLGHLYEVSPRELERLTQTPPEQRGQHIRALQQFSFADEPAPAPAWAPPHEPPPPGYTYYSDVHYWVPDLYLNFGRPTYTPPPPRVSVHGASPVGGSSGGGGGSSGGGSGGGGSIGSGGKDGGLLLVATIVAGVAVGAGLTLSEGLRYDGVVAIHPHHPLHLLHENGHEELVALDELHPGHLRRGTRALIVAHEGAGMWELGRAPLDRQGFTFQWGAGADRLALPGGHSPSGMSFRFALGYFPLPQLGLLGETRLQGFNDGRTGSFYNARAGLEAQLMPVALWRLHLGGFAGFGRSWYGSGGSALPDTEGSRPYLQFGALAELDLSTRLGLTFRWTQDYLPGAGSATPPLTTSWNVGFSVY